MTEHDHREFLDWCPRCDLSRAEVASQASCKRRVLLRGFGFNIMHLADVDDEYLIPATTNGHPFTAVPTYGFAYSLCGVQPRTMAGPLSLYVVMRPDETALNRTCWRCKQLNGINPEPIFDPYEIESNVSEPIPAHSEHDTREQA